MRRLALTLSLALMLGAAAPVPGIAAAASAAPRTVRHVFVIDLENQGFDASFGPSSPATYLRTTLPAKGQLLTQYFAIGHVSLDNYIAQISGQGPDKSTEADCLTYTDFVATGTGPLGQVLGDGCVYPASVKTIADQLEAKHLTWRAYVEDIGNAPGQPRTCRHPAPGSADTTLVARHGDMYATRHNPFVYFHSIVDSPTCAKNDIGLDRLSRDLARPKSTPNFSFISPNVCHDGHDKPCVDGEPGGLVSADAFLRHWVPKILSSRAFKKDGLLVVTFDEADTGDARSCCGATAAPNAAGGARGGGRVGAVVVSRLVKPGSTNETPYNHYALLCSIEDLFGLEHLGLAGQPGLKCFGPDVYNRAG